MAVSAIFINNANQMTSRSFVYFRVFSTRAPCVKYRFFLKTLKFQCTLSDQTKIHKTWPDCLSKNTTELLEYQRRVVLMSKFLKRVMTLSGDKRQLLEHCFDLILFLLPYD